MSIVRRLLLMTAAAVLLIPEWGCGSRSPLSGYAEESGVAGASAHGTPEPGALGPSPAGGRANGAGGSPLPTSSGGTHSLEGSGGSLSQTSGGTDHGIGGSRGGAGSGGETSEPLSTPMVSGEMTATTLGLYLSATSELKAWVYRFSFDGSLISRWEVGDRIVSLDGLLHIGTDLYVSGTEITETNNIPRGFLKRYEGEGKLVWSQVVSEALYLSDAPIATDGTDVLLVSSPIVPSHCYEDTPYGVAIAYCYPLPGEDLPPTQFRRFGADGAIRTERVLDSVERAPFAFEVGPNGHLYLGVGSNADGLPCAEFDASGSLLVDHAEFSGISSGYLRLRGLQFDAQGTVYVLSQYSSMSANFGDYPIRRIAQDGSLSETSRPLGAFAYFAVDDFLLTQDSLYFVGDRAPPEFTQSGGLAVQTDLNGGITYEASKGEFLGESFTAVLEAPNGRVYLGGHKVMASDPMTDVFVRAWPPAASSPD